MTDTRFDGPDCGIAGCQREVGHGGDHHRVEMVTPLSIDRQMFGLDPLTPDMIATAIRTAAGRSELPLDPDRVHVGLAPGWKLADRLAADFALRWGTAYPKTYPDVAALEGDLARFLSEVIDEAE